MNPDDPNAQPVGSFRVPVVPPSTDPDLEPLVGVCFNEDWLPFVIGALKQLSLQTTWDTGAGPTLELTQDRVANLIFQFGEGCPQVFFSGMIVQSASASIPAGYLLCDGSAVSRTIYSALFSAIGTIFGAGDGSTTFNVPDMRGRSPLGAGTGTGLSPRALGNTGGEEAHQLTVAELASHSHALQEHPLTGTAVPPPLDAADALPHIINSTGSTGNDVAHNTMHPFLVTNFLIKT
jgi:microcystin-dependent protein